MSERKLNLKKISNESFNIAIIKTTLYYLVYDTLIKSNIGIDKNKLMKLIDEIPLDDYKKFEMQRNNEVKFNELFKNKAEIIISLYIKRTKL